MEKLKRLLCILLILGLSVLWIVSSWVINDELYYLFEELKYNETGQVEISKNYAVWAAIFLCSSLLVKLALNRISPNPKYDFLVWVVIATLLILFYLTNRGHSWCIIASICGIPALGLNYIINGFRTKYFTRLKRLNIFVFLAVFLVGAIGEYDSIIWSSTETKQYQIDASCYSFPSFLDWPCDCEIEIEDKFSGESSEYAVSFGNGPFFEICKDLATNEVFLQAEFGGECTFELSEEKIVKSSYPQTRDSSQIKIIAFHGANGFE